MYKTIMMFDTSIVSENLGDFIIMDSVKRQLRTLFPDSFFVSTATHDTIGKAAKVWQKNAEFSFIGGTNLLTDRYRGLKRAQWQLGLCDTSVKGAIGIGAEPGCQRANHQEGQRHGHAYADQRREAVFH